MDFQASEVIFWFWASDTKIPAKGLPSRKCLAPLTLTKINNLAKMSFLPSSLGLALKTRGTAKEPVTTQRENLPAAEGSRDCSVHASLAAACLGWRHCQQERVTRRGGAAWKWAWMLQSFSPFASLAFPPLGTGCKPIPISMFRIGLHQLV